MKTDPGEYMFWMDRFWSGRSGFSRSPVPLAGGDPSGEPVRIVRGRGHQREDLARLRVERDDRPDPLAEILLREILELRVERHEQVLPGARLQPVGFGHLAAMRVHDDATLAVCPGEQPLVGALDPLLPDPVADLVDAPRALDLIGRGLREIPESVRGAPPLLVQPALRNRDREFGMLGRAHLDGGDLFDPEVLGDRNRKELRLAAAPLHSGLHLFLVQAEQVDDEVDRGLQVARLAAVEVQRVRGLILDEDRAVAVEHVAARGRDLDGPDTVVLRQQEVVLAAHDLDEPVRHRPGATASRRPRRARSRCAAPPPGGPRGSSAWTLRRMRPHRSLLSRRRFHQSRHENSQAASSAPPAIPVAAARQKASRESTTMGDRRSSAERAPRSPR